MVFASAVLSLIAFLLIRFVVGGEPWGIGFWITAAICLLIVRPIIQAFLEGMTQRS